MTAPMAPQGGSSLSSLPKRTQENASSMEVHEGFPSGAAVNTALAVQNPESLKAAITTFRNQLTIRHDEHVILSQDARLIVAKGWLELSPAAKQMFDIWDYYNSNQQNIGFTPLLLSALGNLLVLLDSHYIYHPLGLSVIKILLGGNYVRRLAAYVGGTQADLVLITLRLFNAMAKFAAGKESKAVMEVFPWGIKALPKLLTMRRRSKEEPHNNNPFIKPDIRTAYITFILTFISGSSPHSVKTAFLDQREIFTSVFREISRDPYLLVEKILKVSWEGIWCDPKMRRTTKVGLFSEWTLGHLVKLYERGEPEGSPDHIPSELVHHFLLAVCTRPGTGLCYRDRGWYQRQVEDEKGPEARYGLTYNKILGNFVKTLKVHEDARQLDLVLQILGACPELVSEYWSGSGLTLEPRLSSRWITNIAFAGAVISLPIPTTCLLITVGSDQYNPIPPPRSNILAAIFPSTLTKAHTSKGLQSPSRLVQHLTAVFLSKSLAKCLEVLKVMSEIDNKLGGTVAGIWAKRRDEVLVDLIKRFPDLQVIFALSQYQGNIVKGNLKEVNDAGLLESNHEVPRQESLVQEASLRLLRLYQSCFPEIVAETRLDMGKVLWNTVEGGETGRLILLNRLHALRILSDNEGFNWTGKLGTSSHSAFHHLLRILVASRNLSIRVTASHLIAKLLSRSILFEHDPSEVEIWLSAFSSLDDNIPPGRMKGDAEGFVGFLDDCLQRCLKTPYRYIEESLHLFDQSKDEISTDIELNSRMDPQTAPSPVLFTIIEQFRVRYAKGTLLPLDSLRIATFLRKFVIMLAGKQPDLRYVRSLSKVILLISLTKQASSSISFESAIRREAQLLKAVLAFSDLPVIDSAVSPSPEGEISLTEDIASEPETAISRLASTVHSIRLYNIDVSETSITSLVNMAALEAPNSPMLSTLLEHLDRRHHLWTILCALDDVVRRQVSFSWVFLQAGPFELQDHNCLDILAEVFTVEKRQTVLRRNLQIVLHRLHESSESREGDHIQRGIVRLIGAIFKGIQGPAVPDIKSMLFSDSQVRIICLSKGPGATDPAFHLSSALNPLDCEDQGRASPFVSHWVRMMMDKSTDAEILGCTKPWIPFMSVDDLRVCLDLVLSDYVHEAISSRLDFITDILLSIRAYHPSDMVSAIAPRFSDLLHLRSNAEAQGQFSTTLTDVIEQSLPIGICMNGVQINKPFSVTILAGIRRWREKQQRSLVNVRLTSESQNGLESWDSVDIQIASALMYRNPSFHAEMIQHFSVNKKDWIISLPVTHLPVIHACLDISISHPALRLSPAFEQLRGSFKSLVNHVLDRTIDTKYRKMAGSTAILLMQTLSKHEDEFNASIITAINGAPSALMLDMEVISFFGTISGMRTGSDKDILDPYIESGLKWIVRRFAEDPFDSPHFLRCLSRFGGMIKRTRGIKSYIAEPVLIAAIQHRVSSKEALEFASILARGVNMKPVNTNRLIQALVQHNSLSSAPRDPLTALLLALFLSHPTNTCQVSHITPLIRLYRGTQDVADRRLLSVFQLFETHRKVSITSLMSRWSAIPGSMSQGCYGAVISVDPSLMFRTCTSFPHRQKVVLDTSIEVQDFGGSHHALYDPAFVLALTGSCLVGEGNGPKSSLEWVEFFRSNVGSLAISALSSKQDCMRRLGRGVLKGLWKAIHVASFQERDQTVYILSLLRDLLDAPSASESYLSPTRLPTYAALVLAHALHSVFYPSTFIYPIVSRFLLQRPQLDAKDVPMLYGMLYSSSIASGGSPAESEVERNWMIRFLADGMKSTADWKVLKRRHTWDLLATMFQSSSRDKDRGHRLGIMQVLLRLTSNREAVTSLVLGSGLLSWVEMQILHSAKLVDEEWKEHTSWIQILDHIVWTLDWQRAEKVGGKGWIESIGRCLLGLMKWGIPSMDGLVLTCRIITRLTTLSSETSMATSTMKQIQSLVDVTLSQLQSKEADIDSSAISPDHLQSPNFVFPHYTSGEIVNQLRVGSPEIIITDRSQADLSGWGECVTLLWQVVMMLDCRHGSWDALTMRMLIWNSWQRESSGWTGDASCPSEWARQEVISCLTQG